VRGEPVLDGLEHDDSESPSIGLVPDGVSWEEVQDHLKIAHGPLLVRQDGEYTGLYWTGTQAVAVGDLSPDLDQALGEFRDALREAGQM
jgi:hypothetical protein